MWAVTASLIVFETARIASIFVTFDYVLKLYTNFYMMQK